MVLMYINTIVAAGSCGYALANHHQRIGTENAAEVAILRLPIVQKQRKENGLKPDLVPVAFLLDLVSLAIAVWTVWVSCTYNPGDVALAVMGLSGWLFVSLYFWTCFVDGCLMNCAIFSSSYELQMLSTFFFWSFITLTAVFGIIFGDSGVAIFTWLTAMYTAGLFGYTLAVYHKYTYKKGASAKLKATK